MSLEARTPFGMQMSGHVSPSDSAETGSFGRRK